APHGTPRRACQSGTAVPRDPPVPVPSPLGPRVSPALRRWPRAGLFSSPLSLFPRRSSPVSDPTTQARPRGPRDLFFFTHPGRWDLWPFLPVVRRHPDGSMDYGVLYDFVNTSGCMGYSCTVFLQNIFLLPDTEEGLLALPKETFDTPDELL